MHGTRKAGDDGSDPEPPGHPQGNTTAATLLGDSPVMRRVRERLARLAPTHRMVLLHGETGTGQGVAARLVHELSARPDGPFVQVNCGALPEHLIESELFGHERGAFTGAVARKPGR